MFISLNLKGVETIHSIEPNYNILHDRWDSMCKVNVPKGTLKIIGIESRDVAYYEINTYINNTALIESTNKINF